MFGIFTKKPLLDSETTQWLYDAYAWALECFGSDIFYDETILVTPTNKHFPDTVGNADEMASKVFDRVKQFSGMMNWECKLVAQNEDANPIVSPTVMLQGAPRSPAEPFQWLESINQKQSLLISLSKSKILKCLLLPVLMSWPII